MVLAALANRARMALDVDRRGYDLKLRRTDRVLADFSVFPNRSARWLVVRRPDV